MSEEKTEQAVVKKSGRVVVFGVIAVVVLVVAGAGLYFFQEYQKAQALLKDPTLSAKLEQQKLIEKIGKLIELPVGEEPTVATVSDVNKLKGQSFFAKAQNGFKVLIYPKAKKAVLYDPAANKIIEVGPINIGDASSSAPSPAVSQTPIKVVIYNGTKTVGLAGTVEKQLKEKAAYVSVVGKGNAKETYKKTVVVDLAGNQKAVAQQLAKLLNGEVGPLPEGETKPATAQIFIILGKE